MKRITFAAAALLLGTSGFALAAQNSAEIDAKLEAGAKMAGAEKLAYLAALSSTASLEKEGAAAMNATATAALEPKLSGIPRMQTVSWSEDPSPTGKTVAMASAEDVEGAHSGMGGPYEEIAARSDGTHDLTPRPAVKNYPPCDPGPGDDHCIQLYEPGVRQALASWNREGGGLWTGETEVAMGGPYEPVDGEAELAMNGDGTVDADKGETAATESVGADLSHHSSAGVGGPIEAQAGYPPCRPGPGDDRCIQLYEPGVTGAGN